MFLGILAAGLGGSAEVDSVRSWTPNPTHRYHTPETEPQVPSGGRLEERPSRVPLIHLSWTSLVPECCE